MTKIHSADTQLHPSHLWPERRMPTGHAPIQHPPEAIKQLGEGNLISGILVGTGDKAIQWIQELSNQSDRSRSAHLVLVIYPACSTQSEHLMALQLHQASLLQSSHKISIRLLPVESMARENRHIQSIPPSVIHSYDKESGRSRMWVGSVGDLGADPLCAASFNMLFEPDAGLSDSWRNWFQCVQGVSVPLTADTARIPDLAPARGEPAAAELWRAYCKNCIPGPEKAAATITMDPKKGEVIETAEGETPESWDGGALALDETAMFIERLYAGGVLVTVNESTRIKPLSIAVRAKLLGQVAEWAIGAVRQRQSFTLQVLGDDINKALDKARSIAEPIAALSFPLGSKNHWMPEAAKTLLEREVKARSAKGKQLLEEALGANVGKYIADRADQMRKDLNAMYSELGRGRSVPPATFESILLDAQARLEAALKVDITPSPAYNRITAPRLEGTDDDASWDQPLSLLSAAACRFRKLLTDPYEPRKFSKMAFTTKDFTSACNMFKDTILTNQDYARAEDELTEIATLLEADSTAKEKCKALREIAQRTIK